ncbi:glycan-binding surface protein [Sphingobacterium sp. ML3W]|uniref:glycan-binding surface protein n=1 Tax=Sphingobacterium sp. ML3W TaxID=1538644 RepID=UPI00249A872E|nr:glycan-binding surface protein [Sphingobacterium sp. ML3W]WFA82120.1 glycan-binding surface protein [Sphingobacterium sp. ML3W]
MKAIYDNNRFILFVFIAIIMLSMLSCSRNNDLTMTPEITHVRLTDPEKADSTFTGAFPGTMVAVIGKNLDGIQKIYINDQQIGFNANYCTSTSAIISIPADLLLTGTNPDLPNEIRIETSHGEARFKFHIYSPAPQIARIELKYPAKAGEVLRIYGLNFYEVQKIAFESATGGSIPATEYEVGKDYDKIELKIPSGIQDGRLAVYCMTDSVSIAFTTHVSPPIIKSWSSDMPIIGDQAFITGNNFIEVTRLTINGEFDIPGEDLTVANSKDTIYYRLPKAPTKSGTIMVHAAGGQSKSSLLFYPIQNLVLDWDKVGSYDWGDNNMAVMADGSKPPFFTTGTAYRIFGTPGAWQYWWGNLSNKGSYPTVNTIPANTPISSLVLRFECFVNEPLATATFDLQLKGNGDKMVSDYVPRDRNTNKTNLGKWMTCDILLNRFTTVADYGSFAAIASSELGIFTKNKADNANVKLDIYFDNFRIIDTNKN